MTEQLNSYIFLDENNNVIDAFVFDELTCTDDVINNVKNAINAHSIIRTYCEIESINSVPTYKYFGPPSPGYVWDGTDTFLPPKPGEDYILNYDRTLWIKDPTKINRSGDMQ